MALDAYQTPSEESRDERKRRQKARREPRARAGGDRREPAEMNRAGARGGRRKTAAAAVAPSPPWAFVLGVLLAISTVILVLFALGVVSLPVSHGGPRAAAEHEEIAMPVERQDLETSGARWTEVISWEPRAFIYHNFLTKEECEYLIEVAKPSMEKSTVVDDETGESVDSRFRTSSGTFLTRGQDEIIRNIEQRIAEYTFIPVDHGEALQVLHYEVGQQYEAHYDYFADEFNTKNGGQRIATMLMYLTDVEEGGETVFPNAKTNSSSLPYYNELSECGRSGLAVKPKMGDALLFWSMKPDSSEDPSSLHAGCPVIKGNKWSSTKWMHINQFRA